MAESARHSGRKTPWKTILAVLPVVAIAAGDYKDAAAGETAALQNIVMSPCPFDAGHGDVRHARRIRAGAARVWPSTGPCLILGGENKARRHHVMQQQNMGERTPQGTPRHAGPKPLNTPEELRAIRQAMDEGKNPLLATGVPRWEDQVGVSRIINRRVLELEPLPTPAQVRRNCLLTPPRRRSSPTRATRYAPACMGRTTVCSSSSAPARCTTRTPRSTTRTGCRR